MKIKEVCEKTGLTDKAVRTYIREGLISPNYEENYRGRKSFDFSDNDIEQLKRIVVLRKYNFSLKEISSLFNNEIEANELLNKHITETKSDVNSDINVINSMINVCKEHPTNKIELCEMLNTPEIANKPIPVIDYAAPYRLKNIELIRSKKNIKAFSITLLIAIVILVLYILINSFFASMIFNHSNALAEFVGFCIVESDTAENTFNDIEKNYELYTDSIIMIDSNSELLKVNDINNSFVSVDIKAYNKKPQLKFNDKLNKNYNYDAIKYFVITAEYKPTKEYYKIIPILSNDQDGVYTDIAFSSAWIKNNENFEYTDDYMACSNGIFELDVKFAK